VSGHAVELDPAVNRVLPDGCMDVIFDLRDSNAAGGIVVGAMLTASVFHHIGCIDMLGVRFVPGAAPLFLRAPAGELTAATIPADSLWHDSGDFQLRLLECANARERLTLLDRYLLARVQPRAGAEAALQGMALIERARGLLRVELLCRSLGVNERALQRAFANQVGLTPKQAIRIMRFRNAVMQLQGAQYGTLASIALNCGYADQAHFTREFRELAAVTPREFAREKGLVGFVQDPVHDKE
jgi:AraC-like DNA-binding protein